MDIEELVGRCISEGLISKKMGDRLLLLSDGRREAARRVLKSILEVSQRDISEEARSAIISRLFRELEKIIEEDREKLTKGPVKPAKVTRLKPLTTTETSNEQIMAVYLIPLLALLIGLLLGWGLVSTQLHPITITYTEYRTATVTVTTTQIPDLVCNLPAAISSYYPNVHLKEKFLKY